MRIPSMIILSMPERVRTLQKLWREHGMLDELALERLTDEVIDNVLACLDRSNVAHSALLTFTSSRAYIESQYNSDAFVKLNSDMIHKLGWDFYNLFIEHRLYLNGKMDYVYSGRVTNREIMLLHFK